MYKCNPLSIKDIRKLAMQTRIKLGIGENDKVDIIKILEKDLHNIVEGFDFEIVGKGDMGNDHGRTIPSKKMIQIREDIYYRAIKGQGRDRSTIAHEIGHLLMHKSGTAEEIVYSRNRKPYEDPEWQANCFAAEFLIPSQALNKMTAEEISNTYGVSLESAKYQKNKGK